MRSLWISQATNVFFIHMVIYTYSPFYGHQLNGIQLSEMLKLPLGHIWMHIYVFIDIVGWRWRIFYSWFQSVICLHQPFNLQIAHICGMPWMVVVVQWFDIWKADNSCNYKSKRWLIDKWSLVRWWTHLRQPATPFGNLSYDCVCALFAIDPCPYRRKNRAYMRCGKFQMHINMIYWSQLSTAQLNANYYYPSLIETLACYCTHAYAFMHRVHIFSWEALKWKLIMTNDNAWAIYKFTTETAKLEIYRHIYIIHRYIWYILLRNRWNR